MSVTAADLLSTPLVPLEFIVDQLTPYGLTILAGAPKTGKSYFALQLALAVAQGERFLGRRTKQGDVLYFALEDGSDRLTRRLHQLAPAMRDLGQVSFNFTANRLREGLEADLDAWYARVERPRLIVVDTFGRIDPGPRGRQTEYAHMTSILGPLQQWALERKVAILLVHHTRKPGAAEMQSGDVFNRILGSQGILGVVDAAYVMLRGRRDQTAELHLTSRDFEEDALALTVDPATMWWSATVLQKDPLAKFSDRRREIVEILMTGSLRLKDVAARLGTTESNAIQHLEKAIRDGVVVKVSRGVYALDEDLAEELVPVADDDVSGGTGLDEDAQDLDFADLTPDAEEFDFS